ncbi:MULTISPECIES: hypothetical protein [Cupriavidus]
MARLLAAIERQLPLATSHALRDPTARQSARAAIAGLRDALVAQGHLFDEADRLRLFFLDWRDETRRREAAHRARIASAWRGIREPIAIFARTDPQDVGAGVWQAVAGLRLELSAEAAVTGDALLRLYALLGRAGPAMPYLAWAASAPGLSLADDPAPAWVLSFMLPVPGPVWTALRHSLLAQAQQIRGWDFRDAEVGRTRAPVCADVTDLFQAGVATPLAAGGIGPPEPLRGPAGRA